MGGESRDNNGRLTKDRAERNGVSDEVYHMKPVYEGYFYTIHWVPTVLHKSNGMPKTFKTSKNCCNKVIQSYQFIQQYCDFFKIYSTKRYQWDESRTKAKKSWILAAFKQSSQYKRV